METILKYLEKDFVTFTRLCVVEISDKYGFYPMNMNVAKIREFAFDSEKSPEDYADWWIENEYEADDYFEPPTVNNRVV